MKSTVWLVRNLANHPECITSVLVLGSLDQVFSYWKSKYNIPYKAEILMDGRHGTRLRNKGLGIIAEDATEFPVGCTKCVDLLTESDYTGSSTKLKKDRNTVPVKVAIAVLNSGMEQLKCAISEAIDQVVQNNNKLFKEKK